MSLATLPRRRVTAIDVLQWRPFLDKFLHTGRSIRPVSPTQRARFAPPPLLCPRVYANSRAIIELRSWDNRRCIHIPNLLLPPVVFSGLLVALWVWKCIMMVVFQNKIIYMPSMPPNARWEQIADYASRCGGVQWTEERTKAADGTDLALAVTTVPVPGAERNPESEIRRLGGGGHTALPPHIYILYFQGNASSTPPRLPDLSWVLRAVSDNKPPRDQLPTKLTFVCLSYRGYWRSRGRATEKGINLDAEAGARWIAQTHRHMYPDGTQSPEPALLVWGQSIGSGIATNLAASHRLPSGLPVKGLILETPFLNTRAMLETLYPQKWLPYKYLWPFLWNHLDSWANFAQMAGASEKTAAALPAVFILEAERDELVPREHGEKLYQRCKDLGFDVEKASAPVAYHSEAITRGGGKKLAAEAILRLVRKCSTKSV